MVAMSLSAEGQLIEMQENIKVTFLDAGDEHAMERPADLGSEYKYVARFWVEGRYVPWMSDELEKEELQKIFSQLMNKSGFKLPDFDALRPFFDTEIGGAIKFSQDKEGLYAFDIYGIDHRQTNERAYGVYVVCKFGGYQMELQRQAEELKQQEERLGILRMEMLEAQLHVERSERAAQKKYGGLTKEVRTTLESRKWQLEVDLAGLKARMNMAQVMKKDTGVEIRLELEKIQVNGQIEMAGIMAQKDKIGEILKMADEYDSQILPHLEQLSVLEYEMMRTEIAHEQLQKKELSTDFEVKNNMITIYPLKEEGKFTRGAKPHPTWTGI